MAAPALFLAGFQIISGIQQAEIVRENARLTKEVNDMNAEYAELDAYRAELNGESQEARYQSVIDSTLGSQKVALASQGVDITFGTAKELEAESKLNGFLNQVDIRNQAHQQALGYKQQARSIRLSGSQAVAQAEVQASAIRNTALISGAKTALPTVTGYFKKNPSLLTTNPTRTGP